MTVGEPLLRCDVVAARAKTCGISHDLAHPSLTTLHPSLSTLAHPNLAGSTTSFLLRYYRLAPHKNPQPTSRIQIELAKEVEVLWNPPPPPPRPTKGGPKALDEAAGVIAVPVALG